MNEFKDIEWGILVFASDFYARSLFVLNRLYAFDVHCNAYFPLFVVLYGTIFVFDLLMYYFSAHVFKSDTLFKTIIIRFSNSISIARSWYVMIHGLLFVPFPLCNSCPTS